MAKLEPLLVSILANQEGSSASPRRSSSAHNAAHSRFDNTYMGRLLLWGDLPIKWHYTSSAALHIFKGTQQTVLLTRAGTRVLT